jgi:hypothetical protein
LITKQDSVKAMFSGKQYDLQRVIVSWILYKQTFTSSKYGALTVADIRTEDLVGDDGIYEVKVYWTKVVDTMQLYSGDGIVENEMNKVLKPFGYKLSYSESGMQGQNYSSFDFRF